MLSIWAQVRFVQWILYPLNFWVTGDNSVISVWRQYVFILRKHKNQMSFEQYSHLISASECIHIICPITTQIYDTCSYVELKVCPSRKNKIIVAFFLSLQNAMYFVLLSLTNCIATLYQSVHIKLTFLSLSYLIFHRKFTVCLCSTVAGNNQWWDNQAEAISQLIT
jgi:hypothetical protein